MTEKIERVVLAVLACGALAFNALPYIYEQQNNSPEYSYIGAYPVLFDKSTNISEMRQGYEGGWRIVNRYSHEQQRPVFLYSFYTTLGHIARVFNISLETTFFFARFIFGFLLLCLSVITVRHFLRSGSNRCFAYLFLFFGSGLGWIPGAPFQSLDLWIPDFIPMVRFSYFPHMMAANALFLGTVVLSHQAWTTQNMKKIIGAGFLAGILAIVLPFHLLLLYPLIFVIYGLSLWKQQTLLWQSFRLLVVFFALSLPTAAFQLSIGLFNPIWKTVEEANILPMPSIISVLFGLGLLVPFFIIGIRRMLIWQRDAGILLAVWVGMAILFSYIVPVPIHRRFIETGLYVPLAIGASYGALPLLSYFVPRVYSLFRTARNIALLIILAIGLFGTNFFNFSVFKASVNAKNDPRIFARQSLVAGLERLKLYSEKDDIVFSSFLVGNLIPAYANRTVYVGHSPLTIAIEQKSLNAKRFFNRELSPDEARLLLSKIPSRVVVESYIEQSGQSKPLEKAYRFLEPVFTNDAMTIYRVF